MAGGYRDEYVRPRHVRSRYVRLSYVRRSPIRGGWIPHIPKDLANLSPPIRFFRSLIHSIYMTYRIHLDARGSTTGRIDAPAAAQPIGTPRLCLVGHLHAPVAASINTWRGTAGATLNQYYSWIRRVSISSRGGRRCRPVWSSARIWWVAGTGNPCA